MNLDKTGKHVPKVKIKQKESNNLKEIDKFRKRSIEKDSKDTNSEENKEKKSQQKENSIKEEQEGIIHKRDALKQIQKDERCKEDAKKRKNFRKKM